MENIFFKLIFDINITSRSFLKYIEILRIKLLKYNLLFENKTYLKNKKLRGCKYILMTLNKYRQKHFLSF